MVDEKKVPPEEQTFRNPKTYIKKNGARDQKYELRKPLNAYLEIPSQDRFYGSDFYCQVY